MYFVNFRWVVGVWLGWFGWSGALAFCFHISYIRFFSSSSSHCYFYHHCHFTVIIITTTITIILLLLLLLSSSSLLLLLLFFFIVIVVAIVIFVVVVLFLLGAGGGCVFWVSSASFYWNLHTVLIMPIHIMTLFSVGINYTHAKWVCFSRRWVRTLYYPSELTLPMQNEFCFFKTRSPTCIYSTLSEFIFTTRFILWLLHCVYFISIYFYVLWWCLRCLSFAGAGWIDGGDDGDDDGINDDDYI